MGFFRFRRSIRVLPGVRINLGKRGASVSIGGRGAHVTVGQNGTRTTVGLPGTGLSYTHVEPPAAAQERPAEDQAPAADFTALWIALAVAAVAVVFWHVVFHAG